MMKIFRKRLNQNEKLIRNIERYDKKEKAKQQESKVLGQKPIKRTTNKKEKKTKVATKSLKPVPKEAKKPADEMSDVNLSTQFKSLDHVAEVLNATPEEVENATRAITADLNKGKFTSYKGKVFDDLNAIHPGNWSEPQTQKIIEAISFAREEKGKAKSGS